MIQFIEYPKCSTCRKAEKWLQEHNVQFEKRDIKEDNPTKEELEQWYTSSGMDIKKFFNTSGNLYKERKLKDRLPEMSIEEKIELLSTDGMLVKRPILITDKGITTGFKAEVWENLI